MLYLMNCLYLIQFYFIMWAYVTLNAISLMNLVFVICTIGQGDTTFEHLLAIQILGNYLTAINTVHILQIKKQIYL